MKIKRLINYLKNKLIIKLGGDLSFEPFEPFRVVYKTDTYTPIDVCADIHVDIADVERMGGKEAWLNSIGEDILLEKIFCELKQHQPYYITYGYDFETNSVLYRICLKILNNKTGDI